jgi:hypothetical protein
LATIVTCPICRGSGRFFALAEIYRGAAGAPPPKSKPKCDACDGKGLILRDQPSSPRSTSERWA